MIERLLMRWSAKLPAREITSPAGQPYLERYHVVKLGPVTVLLHRYLGSDGEREVHNHPWSWACSFVLKGAYVEERVLGLDVEHGWRSLFHLVRFFNLLGPLAFHRLHRVREGTWTLFIHGRRVQKWGFLSKVEDALSTRDHLLEVGHQRVVFHQPFETNPDPAWHRNASKGVDLPSRRAQARQALDHHHHRNRRAS